MRWRSAAPASWSSRSPSPGTRGETASETARSRRTRRVAVAGGGLAKLVRSGSRASRGVARGLWNRANGSSIAPAVSDAGHDPIVGSGPGEPDPSGDRDVLHLGGLVALVGRALQVPVD